LWPCARGTGHVLAQAMGEVRGVQARLDPSSYPVRYTKCGGICVSNLAEEEGILSAFRAMVLVYGSLARFEICDSRFTGIVQRVRVEIGVRVESVLLSRI
jgi:hypothetical protein